MKYLPKKFSTAAFGIAVCALMPAMVHASTLTGDYFVQPVIQYGGGGFINGLVKNGATVKTESYNNAPVAIRAQANLRSGSLKGRAKTEGGSEFAYVQTRFGDTIKVDNAAGTDATFTLDVNGRITSDPRTPELNSLMQISVDAYFAIFDVGAGADETNWGCVLFTCTTITPPTSAALATDRYTVNFDNHDTAIDFLVNELLEMTVPVTQNGQEFMIFANLTLTSSRNANPGTTDLDFFNTATLGIDLVPGASFTSASGVLLRGDPAAPIPLPASGFLLIGGLAGLAALRRRRRGT